MKRIPVIIFLFTVLCAVNGIAQSDYSDATTAIRKSVKTPATKTTKQRTSSELQLGLFGVQQVEKDWFLEIPEDLLGKQILVTARYISTSTNIGKYGGELFNQQVVYWEMAPNGKLLLRSNIIVNRSDSLDDIHLAVMAANENPIIAAFTPESHKAGRYRIKAISFMADNAAFSLSKSNKSQWGLSSLIPDLSYIESIHTFPTNTEIRMTKTWASNSSSYHASAYTEKVTMRVNLSFIKLPEDPMPARLFDPRVGYFANYHTYFSDHQQATEFPRVIRRWRLEPKDSADLRKWEARELIEPKKPIVYYIDPATPRKWRKYLIQGVNDWQVAFEKAGFKNAIMAKEWPENRPDMSMEDARYSCIRYLASTTRNAYGPNVNDPRTGEILESHICWYHNVMALLHDWYFVQASTLDEAAQQMQYDDELMGQLIRFVSSHEVGHTLGLRHNFGASSTVPVDSLRSKTWVEAHGHTPSIMDYARFNYVAQPEDGISRTGIFPRIGPYDCWAIQWGYTLTPKAYDPESDHWEMERLTATTLQNHPELWFGDGETNVTRDPRCLTEDLGDDAVRASEYGLLNLKREIRNLPRWTYQSNDIYGDNLKNMYSQIVSQFSRYAGHVAASIGGIKADYKTVDEEGVIYTPVSRKRQLECLDYLDRNVLQMPEWLISEPYMLRISPNPETRITNIGLNILHSLAGADNLSHLNSELTADELLPEITRRLFAPIGGSKAALRYRRNLQAYYVALMIENFTQRSKTYTSFRPAVLQELHNLQRIVQSTPTSDMTTRNHYASLADAIARALVVR